MPTVDIGIMRIQKIPIVERSSHLENQYLVYAYITDSAGKEIRSNEKS